MKQEYILQEENIRTDIDDWLNPIGIEITTGNGSKAVLSKNGFILC